MCRIGGITMWIVLWAGIGLIVGFLVVLVYSCMVASSNADRLEERYLMLHPPDNGGDAG